MKVQGLVGSFARWAMVPVLVAAVGVGMAQGNSGHDRDDHRDDHHDKGNRGGDDHRGDNQRGDNQRGESGHDNNGRGNNGHDDNDYRFREQDRQNFQSHYNKDVRRWQQRPQGRAQFVRGQRIPDTYQFQVVPSSYYRNVPPPPPGYRYGYHDGYVVAYNPTTRIIADVLDLVTAVSR